MESASPEAPGTGSSEMTGAGAAAAAVAQPPETTAGDEPPGGGSPGGEQPSAEQSGGDQPPAKSHRRRWIILGAAAVVAVVGGTWFAVRWSQRGADEASVTEAVEAARAKGNGVEVSESLLQPATGVYTYASSGTEKLSLLGTAQDWGATIPGSVVAAGDGCWEHRLDYSTHHWHSQVFCPRGDVLEEVTGIVFQSFDFVAATVEEKSDFVCDPPGELIRLDADSGDVWEQSCSGHSPERGTSLVSAGTNEFIGEETLSIEGEDVPVLHYLLTREITGDQTGTEINEQWFHAHSGLLVKSRREIEVASPSPIGDIVYTENGELVLTSLTPES